MTATDARTGDGSERQPSDPRADDADGADGNERNGQDGCHVGTMQLLGNG